MPSPCSRSSCRHMLCVMLTGGVRRTSREEMGCMTGPGMEEDAEEDEEGDQGQGARASSFMTPSPTTPGRRAGGAF